MYPGLPMKGKFARPAKREGEARINISLVPFSTPSARIHDYPPPRSCQHRLQIPDDDAAIDYNTRRTVVCPLSLTELIVPSLRFSDRSH
ncbi:hypothetical protein SISSUDRAFT_1054601, partial [Sistotremastrum suecicum HHB10207 ss-3]